MKPALAYFALIFSLALTACSMSGSDDIPLGVTAYNIYLFDAQKAPNGDHFAGRVETSYLKRKEDLSRARDLAHTEATRLKFDTKHARYYIICTETKESRCVTKLR